MIAPSAFLSPASSPSNMVFNCSGSIPGPNERAESELRQIAADLFYISNWSLLLDAKILLRNLFAKTSYVQKHQHC
jgi:hypothetical protein